MTKFIVIYILLLVGLCVNGDDSNFNGDDHLASLFRRRAARSACPDRNHCRSKWGYCGTGSDYCGAGCQGGPCQGGSSGNSGSVCPDRNHCRSKWGYCGTGPDYCGTGCQGGPCSGGDNNGNGNQGGSSGQINAQNFACVFKDLNAGTRNQRFHGLQATGWKPANAEEAAVFLAHVYHETDGLRTMREYCAPGCGHAYQGGPSSWCKTTGPPGKLYYGRGWFQLSWPCNYDAAGKALGVDLLSNPDLVETNDKLAVSTALWFYRTQGMSEPARRGDFAATTRIINGHLECNGGSGYSHQLSRVETYKRVRQCFNLGPPKINPIC
ncbi:unnamed protein product [Adineta ricciae]|uniref:Chitin-binding type-1 domain-containing protein n=1 Tax=Adineta ricciae TaxID=249248 RepID=A0A815YJF0_ADIRI|nr:unnamed protein product [Adineta ricciae]